MDGEGRTFPSTRRQFARLIGLCFGLILALAIGGSTAHRHHLEWLASGLFFAIVAIFVVGLFFVVGLISPRTPRRLVRRLLPPADTTPTRGEGSLEEPEEITSRRSWAASFAVGLVLVGALVYGGVALNDAGLGWVAGLILILCLGPALGLVAFTGIALLGMLSPRLVHDLVNRSE
ncbi:MAG TPA: hypothetical protein VKB43_06690 [Gaiellaceae bacterium]|nr:hypothetical protein [Gaiellaceae bacterium]